MNYRISQKFLISKIEPLPFKTTIEDQDARHIFKVLRLGPEATISVTDGKGKDYIATILSASSSIIDIQITREQTTSTESPLQITLCSGMLKDRKMDLVIKHVVQLGIFQWIPFFCERSIPSPNTNKLRNRHKRWETIAKESLKQCNRSRLVDIAKPVSFKDLLLNTFDHDLKIAFWEKATQPLANLKTTQTHPKVVILIGPEGGFSENEIQMAQTKGFSSYSLGPRILRAETASIASCTLIQHLLGDI
ncbi:MAG: 16S rRNA (uracil(1498)-N(3))-methyltransferase [Pseudomonadota bacterium]